MATLANSKALFSDERLHLRIHCAAVKVTTSSYSAEIQSERTHNYMLANALFRDQWLHLPIVKRRSAMNVYIANALVNMSTC